HTRFSRDWSSDVCSSDLGIMPRQPGNGEAQDAPLLFKTGTFQPLAEGRLGRSDGLLQQPGGRRTRQFTQPPQRTGRMDIQLGKTAVIGGQSLRGKMAAAVGKSEAVAGQQLEIGRASWREREWMSGGGG